MAGGLRARQVPLRLTTGAFILNSGVGKLGADAETAQHLHGMAKATYPMLAEMRSDQFTRRLALSEVVLGSLLLTPRVPSRLAGAALTAFAGGLIGLYLRTPGMRREHSLRPTREGIALAKDWWLLGAGVALLID